PDALCRTRVWKLVRILPRGARYERGRDAEADLGHAIDARHARGEGADSVRLADPLECGAGSESFSQREETRQTSLHRTKTGGARPGPGALDARVRKENFRDRAGGDAEGERARSFIDRNRAQARSRSGNDG